MLITSYKKFATARITPVFALILALLCVFIPNFAYGGISVGAKEILSPEERLWLNDNQHRLVLAVETGYAPFVYLDADGQPTGLAHDYIRLIESKIGASFKQRQFASLNDIFESVRAGEVQIVNAVTPTPSRSQFLAFTDPFISVPNVILARKDRDGRMSEKNLSGLNISLVKSYAVTDYLLNKKLGFSPDLVTDDLTALLNVSFGHADAAVIDLATASFLISRKGITNLRAAGETEFSIRLAIGTPINEPLLNSILQKGLAAITDAEREAIQKHWINASSQSILSDWRFWLAAASVLIGILAVIIIISIWNRMLSHQVMERTADLEEERANLERRVLERTADLARSEAQLRATLENTPNVAVQWYDDAGRIIYWNSASEKLFGWKAEEALGKTLDTLNHTPETAVEFQRIFAMIRQTGCPYGPFESEIRTRDGRMGWTQSNAFAIPMAEDSIAFVCMEVDITERKLFQQELERQAQIDYLTGVNNRRNFMQMAETELSRAQRYQSPVSLFMMDIDCFKQINDSRGHKAGDMVLRKLAEICRQTLREVDIIGRIGGEEFAVLLPETGKDRAIEVAERLRAAIDGCEAPIDNELPLRFSVSIGVASLVSNDENLDVLINLADQALYQAKDSGRNKVCVSL